MDRFIRWRAPPRSRTRVHQDDWWLESRWAVPVSPFNWSWQRTFALPGVRVAAIHIRKLPAHASVVIDLQSHSMRCVLVPEPPDGLPEAAFVSLKGPAAKSEVSRASRPRHVAGNTTRSTLT